MASKIMQNWNIFQKSGQSAQPYLQKYRHLQMSLTYDVIDASLRRTIKDMVSKLF